MYIITDWESPDAKGVICLAALATIHFLKEYVLHTNTL